MTEVVLYPDATSILIDYLAAAFADRDDTTPVLPRVPEERPARFVVVRRTGGTARAVVIDDAQVTVESWGESDEDAHDLAQLVRGLLHARPYRVAEVSGPGNLPDPPSNQPRYTQTFLTAMRGEAEELGS